MEWNRLFTRRPIGRFGGDDTAIRPNQERDCRGTIHPVRPGPSRILQVWDRPARSTSTSAASRLFTICDILSVCMRLAAFLVLAFLAFAILIGCLTSTGTDRNSAQAFIGHPMPAILRSELAGSGNPGFQMLDPETGRLEPLVLPVGSHLCQVSQASFSPWRDERGQEQIAVSWLNQSSGENILACVSLPSVEVREQIAISVPLQSPPCWDPTNPGQLLFAAGDGQLYLAEFTSGDHIDIFQGTPHQVRPVKWSAGRPGRGPVILADPAWPGTRLLGGRILVSLRYHNNKSDHMLAQSRLWWLKLGTDGSTIVDAGPLAGTDAISSGSGQDEAERYPTVTTAPDGSLFIAFLNYREDRAVGELRIAPLHIEPHTGNPWFSPDAWRVVAERCIYVAPVFSSDSRWVSCLVQESGSYASVRRGPQFPSPIQLAPDRPAEPGLVAGEQISGAGESRVLSSAVPLPGAGQCTSARGQAEGAGCLAHQPQ